MHCYLPITVEAIVQELDDKNIDLYLLSIYDKSDYENISDKLLRSLVQEIQQEIEENRKDSIQIKQEEE